MCNSEVDRSIGIGLQLILHTIYGSHLLVCVVVAKLVYGCCVWECMHIAAM